MSFHKAITSPDNKQFKHWKSLLSSRGLRKQEELLLAGSTFIQEASRRYPERNRGLLYYQGQDLPAWAAGMQLDSYELPRELFDQLDIFGTHTPLLWQQAPSLIPFALPVASFQGLRLICPLGDPANLGAVLRSALAFGVDQVILTKESAHPFHPKSLRASAGASLHLPLVQSERDTLTLIRAIGQETEAPLWLLDMQGSPLEEHTWPPACYLAVGEEGQGWPEALAAPRLAIGMNKDCESLNAAVAVGIALHHSMSSRMRIS